MDSFKDITVDHIAYNIQYLSHLVFEVTDKCNLRCKYCGYAELYDGYDEREGKDLPFAKAKTMIDYLVKIWKDIYSPSVVFPVVIGFYGGEPLMNVPLIKEIIDYIEKIENTGKKFSYNMTTNAMLLDKYMDFLVAKDFQLLISLDGDEMAQSYRVDHSGTNSFSRIFRNIKLLQTKYPDFFQKKVNFNSVLHNRNSVESTHKFITNNFNKSPQIAPLSDSGVRKEKVEEFRRMYQNTMDSILQSENCEAVEAELLMKDPRANQLIMYFNHQTGNFFNNYTELFLNKSVVKRPYTGTCVPFSKRMFVTVNGKILQCERIDQDFVLGYVHDDRVELDYESIAAIHNTNVTKCIKQCNVCVINTLCPECVYNFNDIKESETVCRKFCSKRELDIKNKMNMDFLRKHPDYYEKILAEVTVK